MSLLLVGPRYDRDAGFRDRLSRLIAMPNVQWVGRQSPASLPSFVTAIRVGLTPYARTPFNDASFPLKTLEYLAAGVPVVATPLPANEMLDSRVVRVGASATRFADLVDEFLTHTVDSGLAAQCVSEAQRFDWKVRAADLDAIVRDLIKDTGTNVTNGYSRRGARW